MVTSVFSVNTSTGSVSDLVTGAPNIAQDAAVTGSPPFSPPPGGTLKRKLTAIAYDEFWYEDSDGSMTELTDANGDIDTDDALMVFEGFQKVFIVNETKFRIADFGNSKITTTDIDSGGDAPDRGVILTGSTSAARMVVDYITDSDGAASIYGRRISTATFVSGETVTATGVSFVLNADESSGPHWYTWDSYGGGELSTTYGEMPDHATLGCLYRGRAVLSGNQNYPHQWYMSRQADVFDWLYGAGDAQSPVAGNNADAGEIGDVITALVPYKDDYLLFGCAGSIWRLNGDPAAGGQLMEVDLTRGVFSGTSWCWGPNDTLFFVGSDGSFYALLPTGEIKNLLETSVPSFAIDLALSADTHRVTMGYDPIKRGIVICKTTIADGTNTNYWYDLRTGGLFPEEYLTTASAYSIYYYNSLNPSYRDFLIGGYDGYIRKFSASDKDDDTTDSTTAITSYVNYGVLAFDQDATQQFLISGVNVVLAKDSDSIVGQFFMADTPEEVETAITAATPVPSITHTFTTTTHPTRISRRIRGGFFSVRFVNSSASSSWAFEQISLYVKPFGVWR